MKNGVISIDVNRRDGELVDVVHMDVMDFPFDELQFPVFLRPCHGVFVHEALMRFDREKIVWDALYVSHPDNLNNDIDTELFEVNEINGWTGNDGEHAYYIIIKGEYKHNMKTFVRVKYMNSISWYELIDHPKYGTTLRNSGGGLRQLNKGTEYNKDQILESVSAEYLDDLDWTNTYLNNPEETSGWLSPDGTWTGCPYESHDSCAHYVLKKSVVKLEKEGYCRVHHMNDYILWDGKLTDAQLHFLMEHGVNIKPTDL
jgi:hypothetical protein